MTMRVRGGSINNDCDTTSLRKIAEVVLLR